MKEEKKVFTTLEEVMEDEAKKVSGGYDEGEYDPLAQRWCGGVSFRQLRDKSAEMSKHQSQSEFGSERDLSGFLAWLSNNRP